MADKKEKLASLTKLQIQLKDKLAATVVPPKHTHREKEYRQHLTRELSDVTKTIDALKMGDAPASK